MIELTGGEALWRSLAPERVDLVFGVTGGKLSALMQAIAATPNVRYVGTRHEGAAALMAAGDAAATGRLSMVIGECGTGAVNLASGIAVANANSLPIIAVTSNNQHAVSYPARGMFASMDTESLFRPLTKWNAAVHDGRRIPELVRSAIREACTGRRGAVHLDVPQDLLRSRFFYDPGEFDRQSSDYRLVDGPAPTEAQCAAAARLIGSASKPLMIAGGGVAQSGAAEAFRALAARVGAATAATQSALGVVSSEDPRYAGHAAVISGPAFARACREADVVVAVGCRLSPWLWDEAGPKFGAQMKLIHISTDPAVLGAHWPAGVAIQADARLALAGILERVGAPTARAEVRGWTGSLLATREAHRAALRALAADSTEPMHPATLASEFASALPQDAIVVYDGGHTTFWTNDFTPCDAPRTRFNEAGMTQLGFGLPYALAMKLRRPAAPVFNVTGDGAFGFTVQELDTARRYGLPVVNIVHNNASWGVIKIAHQRGYGFTLGDDLEGTDYAAIARGFGCHGESVSTRAEVAPAIARALASGLPAVIDCRVRFEPHPGLPDFGRMGSYGMAPPPASPAPAAR